MEANIFASDGMLNFIICASVILDLQVPGWNYTRKHLYLLCTFLTRLIKPRMNIYLCICFMYYLA